MVACCRLTAYLMVLIFSAIECRGADLFSWRGTVRDRDGAAVPGAHIELVAPARQWAADSKPDGSFEFEGLAAGSYRLTVQSEDVRYELNHSLELAAPGGSAVTVALGGDGQLHLESVSEPAGGGGGERLSSRAVSELPLNKRDFSQLLLLAAGTMTDSNGATNFTQQFAINGQRGVEAVFAMDGADISDPEMGGATFSNFNVDAVQEIQSSSGWMPAEIGRGAAGFTNIITRPGLNDVHGSVFEFVRNSAFDARNFFDRRSDVNPGRIPPFRRNEFGFTLGGPIVIPRLYNGKNKTFFSGEYQGFRQVLGTTQVIPVPTADERAGKDTTAYAGDTLFVPVDRRIAPDLARYPLPNEPQGPYGVHTFATSSKVRTNADQFSIRIDHQLSKKAHLSGRYSLDNLNGPATNPSQTAIDPSFGINYVDHQRSAVVSLTRDISPRLVSESSVAFTRTTPSFITPNHADPALTFGDGTYESFNAAAGSVTASYGNLFQGSQNFSWTVNKHAVKAGAEFRANRDTTYFGTSPNGQYTFGGGTAYSPVEIRSATGRRDIHPGDPLPDAITSLLTASPFAYTLAVAPAYFPQGDQIGVAAISRYGVNFYIQDSWKISNRLVLEYGLRYELYWPISERAKRTAALTTDGAGQQHYIISAQPAYRLDRNGWGPRVRINWLAGSGFHVRAGGGLTTIPPNIWQDNLLTGSMPFVIYPRITAAPGAPVPFGVPITPGQIPKIYTPDGRDMFASGDTKAVPPNTEMDVNRFERDLAALSPGHQVTPLNINTMSLGFGNSYLATWTLALERNFAGLDANAAYVGTAAVKLPAIDFPNGYPGADPAFARYTQFDAAGLPTGGFGTEMLMTNRSHSSYHALQLSLQGNAGRSGPGLQASYTWAKSLDDTSSVTGGFIAGTSGASAQAWPQNPFDTRAEKAPSTFDIRHALAATVAQDLHADRLGMLKAVSTKVTGGWQLLSISTITSGAPFSIYSGVQQTGIGSNGVDRPDQIGSPVLSTTRKIREDYFGLAAQNAAYFSIPLNVPGGTGPNQGRPGVLGRNTFRGPALHNFDFAVIKETPLVRKGGAERMDLQFRCELFNLFNIVNFAPPANTIRGSGFGQISRTAGTSRQIQFSLKLIF